MQVSVYTLILGLVIAYTKQLILNIYACMGVGFSASEATSPSSYIYIYIFFFKVSDVILNQEESFFFTLQGTTDRINNRKVRT